MAIKRLISGYRRIGAVVGRILAAIITILLAAAAVSLPLWYLASEHRGVFNYTVLLATLGLLAALVMRRVKHGAQHTHRSSVGSRNRLIVLVLTALAGVLGLTISPGLGTAVGIIAVLGLGWAFGTADS